MRCVILQPSYIPWRGYFDLIRRADVFVFYDDVQYDKGGWRNRNRIKTPAGSTWLTVPIQNRGIVSLGTTINEIRTIDDDWPKRHLNTIIRSYANAPHFDEYRGWLERTYSVRPPLLAPFTIQTTIELAALMGITTTTFLRSSEMPVSGRKTDRVLSVLRHVGATHYLSGPAAKSYIDEEAFSREGIALEWQEYNYPEYPQLYPPFDPFVSVLDLLFMTGDQAIESLQPSSR